MLYRLSDLPRPPGAACPTRRLPSALLWPSCASGERDHLPQLSKSTSTRFPVPAAGDRRECRYRQQWPHGDHHATSRVPARPIRAQGQFRPLQAFQAVPPPVCGECLVEARPTLPHRAARRRSSFAVVVTGRACASGDRDRTRQERVTSGLRCLWMRRGREVLRAPPGPGLRLARQSAGGPDDERLAKRPAWGRCRRPGSRPPRRYVAR